MALEWYCEIAGREIGPLSPRQLKAMAESGRIKPGERVRRGQRGEWIPAGRVKGLFPAPGRAASGTPPATPPKAAPPSADPVPPPPPAPAAPPVVRRPDAATPAAEPVRIVADSSDDLLPRLKRRRRQEAKLVAVLLGSVVLLAAAAGYILFGGGDGPSRGGLSRLADRAARRAGEKSTPRKPLVQSPESLEKAEGVISLDKPVEKPPRNVAEILGMDEKEYLSDAGPKEKDDTVEQPAEPGSNPPPDKPAAQTAEKPPEKPPLDDKWIDASTAAAVVGFVSVRIRSAEVVAAAAKAADAEGRLLITVELINAGARDVEFAGWNDGGAATEAKLTDDAGKEYRSQSAVQSKPPGRAPPPTIAAGGACRQTLAFEPPDGRVEYLLLELPAAAFGFEELVVPMKIPAAMIVSRPAAERPRRPRPGTPEYDFGLPSSDESIE